MSSSSSSSSSSSCQKCTGPLEGRLVIDCRGFCGLQFHAKCSGLPEDICNKLPGIDQLFWLCKPCAALMGDIRHRQSVKLAYESGQSQIDTKVVDQLKQEVLAPLKEEISLHFTRLINSSSLTPTTNKQYPLPRRLLNDRQTKLQEGAVGEQPNDVPVVPASKKFWLYLGRISKEVSAEAITTFANARLCTNEAIAHRLVAKGTDLSTLRNISFKVGVPEALRSKALAPSTWPKGVFFREFEDRSASAEDFNPFLLDPPPLE